MIELLTRQTAAERLGISTDTLDRLRKRGQIAYVQHIPNGKVWFTQVAIDEYLARCTHPVRPAAQPRDTYRKRRSPGHTAGMKRPTAR